MRDSSLFLVAIDVAAAKTYWNLPNELNALLRLDFDLILVNEYIFTYCHRGMIPIVVDYRLAERDFLKKIYIKMHYAIWT